MKVIHLLRKPCSEGTVAANVLKFGTGALNIDATRIGTTATGREYAQPTGRWPANLVLQHLPTCEHAACGAGCPVAGLDAQSEGTGASRFFKQLGGTVGGEE